MKFIFYAGLLALTAGITSCDKDVAITSESTLPATTGARQSLSMANPFLLTRRGPDDSFTYEPLETGRIRKVTHGAGSYTNYIYLSGGRRIRRVDHVGENRTGLVEYHINDAGRCTYARQTMFFYAPNQGSLPADSVIVHSYYTYDAMGRLSSKKDVENSGHGSPSNNYNQNHYYFFNKNNDLSEVKTFVGGKLWLDALFEYGQLTPDLLQLNETNTHIEDRYLKIFGVSSTNLVRRINVLQYPFYATNTPITAQDYQYSYTLNRLGLVMQKQIVDALLSKQLPSEEYAYQILTNH